jgi:MFS family permease
LRFALPSALAEPNFARFVTGYTLSLTGSGMVPIAISFTLYAQGGGAAAVSKVLAAETIPMVLLLLLGGAIADRYPRRLVMITADLLRFASQGTLAVLLLTHHAPLPAIMVLMALIGTGNAFYIPGRAGLIPQLVGPGTLQSANGVTAIAQSAGGIAGPIIGGLLVAFTGGAAAIAIDAVSYAISAALLSSLRLGPGTPPPGTSVLTQLREGWTEFRSRTWLWAIVLQFSLLHLLVIGPLFVLGSLGFAHVPHGALGWGGLMALQGAGAVTGGVLAIHLTTRRPIRAACLWFLLYAAVPASLAAHLPYTLTAGCFFLGGVSLAVFNVLWDTTMQRVIPPERLSRVAAYDMFGSFCLLPLGYLVAAPLAVVFGRDGALWLSTAFILLSIAAVLFIRDVQQLRRPEAVLPVAGTSAST